MKAVADTEEQMVKSGGRLSRSFPVIVAKSVTTFSGPIMNLPGVLLKTGIAVSTEVCTSSRRQMESMTKRYTFSLELLILKSVLLDQLKVLLMESLCLCLLVMIFLWDLG